MNDRRLVTLATLATEAGAACCAAALLVLSPASQAATSFYTSVATERQLIERLGPFGRASEVETTSDERRYTPGADSSTGFGALTIDRVSHLRKTESATDFPESTTFVTESGSEEHLYRVREFFPAGELRAFGPRGTSADAAASGVVSVAGSYGFNPEVSTDAQEGFEGAAAAGWTDAWFVPADVLHAAGTAGQMSVTISLSGQLTADDGLIQLPPTTFDLANVTATFGASVLNLGADWTNAPQALTATTLVDFRYGEAFDVSLDLLASAGNFGSFASSDAFSAGIASVVLPAGATIDTALADLNVVAVPEPSSAVLLMLGLAGLGAAARRRCRVGMI